MDLWKTFANIRGQYKRSEALEQIRVNLVGTELARAQAGTIRLKLLKIGAVILRNSRRIRFLLSSAYPYKRLFQEIAERLNPG